VKPFAAAGMAGRRAATGSTWASMLPASSVVDCFFALWFRLTPDREARLTAILLGFAISLVIEPQYFSPRPDSSMTDLRTIRSAPRLEWFVSAGFGANAESQNLRGVGRQPDGERRPEHKSTEPNGQRPRALILASETDRNRIKPVMNKPPCG